MTVMLCPECGSTKIAKRTYADRSERAPEDQYQCKECGCIFRDETARYLKPRRKGGPETEI